MARFDYPKDKDCYAFKPNTTGTYTITTSLTGSLYNVDMYIYDTSGNLLASDTSSSNASITLTLNSGHRYFICVFDMLHNVVNYTLYH